MRIGYRGEATVHGFRGLFSTSANETGRFRPDVIERQLAHAPRDKVRGHTTMQNTWKKEGFCFNGGLIGWKISKPQLM